MNSLIWQKKFNSVGMRNAPTICDKCSSTFIESVDEAEFRCALCGRRFYLPLGRIEKRPFKLQIRYKGFAIKGKRTPLTVGIDDNDNEPSRVMKYQVYCPECFEMTKQGPRTRRDNNNGFHYDIRMKCENLHITTLMESSHTGELFGWR